MKSLSYTFNVTIGLCIACEAKGYFTFECLASTSTISLAVLASVNLLALSLYLIEVLAPLFLVV